MGPSISGLYGCGKSRSHQNSILGPVRSESLYRLRYYMYTIHVLYVCAYIYCMYMYQITYNNLNANFQKLQRPLKSLPVCMYVCIMCVCMYICMHACMYICMQVSWSCFMKNLGQSLCESSNIYSEGV